MAKQTYTSSILITGGTQGLGYQAALTIAAELPSTLIVLASRTDPNSAATTINTKLKQSNVQYMQLDLGTLASVRTFAEKWTAASFPPISALLLNAGLQFPGDIEYTTDGMEKHFAVNHVAHALLFHLLAPYLTPTARIIVVTSGLHDIRTGGIFKIYPRYTNGDEVAKPSPTQIKESAGRDRYATSKAANAIWANALGRHLAHTDKTVLAFDPGLMFGTGLSRAAPAPARFAAKWVLPHLTPLFRLLLNPNINTQQESGERLAWLVTCKEVEGKKAVYYEGKTVKEMSEQSRNKEVQDELWEWTVGRVAQNGEEKEKFGKVGE
jgi:NAD(P)-dependent dehydrogenase (short-subunit alcohol dehydrogenase family)